MKGKSALLPALIVMVITAMVSFPVQSSASGEVTKVEQATQVLKEIVAIPESGIPPALLQNAYGIAIIPGLIKVSFLIGGRHGRGVLLVHDMEKGWSNPSMVSLTGGSFGYQIGAQSTDLILVFKTRRSIDGIIQGKFTLGVDAAAAAGPVGRRAEAATDAQLRAEIYSYSRTRGLFAGVSLEGAAIQIDYDGNQSFYGRPGLLPSQILSSLEIETPAAAVELKKVLAEYSSK